MKQLVKLSMLTKKPKRGSSFISGLVNINILKDKMQLCLNRIGNVFVGVDKEVNITTVVSSDTVTYRDLKVGDIVRI